MSSKSPLLNGKNNGAMNSQTKEQARIKTRMRGRVSTLNSFLALEYETIRFVYAGKNKPAKKSFKWFAETSNGKNANIEVNLLMEYKRRVAIMIRNSTFLEAFRFKRSTVSIQQR